MRNIIFFKNTFRPSSCFIIPFVRMGGRLSLTLDTGSVVQELHSDKVLLYLVVSALPAIAGFVKL